mgnify:FL=1
MRVFQKVPMSWVNNMKDGKKATKAQQRKQSQLAQKGVRWAVQIVFFAAAPGAFSAAFNGVKYIAGQIGGLKAIEPTSFLLLLAGLCAFTVVFGRFFCGYACAFGTLGDALYLLFTPLRSWYVKRFPTVKARPALFSVLRFAKVVVLGVIIVLCFRGSYDSFWSPWTAFAGFTGGSLDGISIIAFSVLAVIAAGMALVERFFCRFLCPLGALFSLLPVLPISQLKRNPQRCSSRCEVCRSACPVHMRPERGGFEMGECIACGRCAAACPIDNISIVSLPRVGELPEKGAGETERMDKKEKTEKKCRLLKGNHPLWVVLRAALLLALLWVFGAVRW